MTDQATRVVPAGWYDDPASPARVRWWNGIAWTEHVADKPSEADQAAAREAAERAAAEAAQAARIAEARRLEQEFGIGTSDIPVVGDWATDGATTDAHGTTADGTTADADGTGADGTGAYGIGADGTGATGDSRGDLRRDRSHRHRPASAATGAAWLLAVSPLLTLVLAAAAGYVYLYFVSDPLVFAAVGVIYLLALLWAIVDARVLRARGFEPASGAWALLGALVYLIARRVRVPGSGPLVTFVVLTVAGGALATVAVLSGLLEPTILAIRIQDELARELVANGTASSVSCPLFLDSVAVGETYTCSATLPGGEERLVWVSIDSADGGFSSALGVR